MTVEAPVRNKREYTVEQFMKMPDDGKEYELIQGELIEMPGPNINHSDIMRLLSGELYIFLKTNMLGKVFSDLAFELGPKTAVRPDVAFVLAERLVGLDRSNAFPGAPDLVVEVMSPTDKWSKVSKKVQLYQQAGARLVWVIDPFDQGVIVYRLNHPRRLLLLEHTLSGEDVVPGFQMLVRSLFE